MQKNTGWQPSTFARLEKEQDCVSVRKDLRFWSDRSIIRESDGLGSLAEWFDTVDLMYPLPIRNTINETIN